MKMALLTDYRQLDLIADSCSSSSGHHTAIRSSRRSCYLQRELCCLVSFQIHKGADQGAAVPHQLVHDRSRRADSKAAKRHLWVEKGPVWAAQQRTWKPRWSCRVQPKNSTVHPHHNEETHARPHVRTLTHPDEQTFQSWNIKWRKRGCEGVISSFYFLFYTKNRKLTQN